MRFITQNTIQNLSKPNLLKIFRLLFVAALTLILILQISKLNLSLSFLVDLSGLIRLPYLLAGLALVAPNYYFEILKWKILGTQLEERDFRKATHDVLRGLKLGIITPLMIGDYWGRSMDFKKENRASAVILNLFNSFTQTWVSLLFGAGALFIWQWMADHSLKKLLLPALVTITITVILGLGVLYRIQPSLLQRWKLTRKYLKDFQLPVSIKNQIVALTIARTLIYNLQYVLFYMAFGIFLSPAIYFTGVNIILLIKTVGGGLNVIGDLSIRELVSINFFGLYLVDQRLILVATFVVWFVNIFIPVIVGILSKTAK